MNRALANRVADAVLYEGYILYPYRPSIKNRQRWTFGGLYPESYCHAQGGSELSANRTECLVRGSEATTIEVIVRFLHLVERQVGEFDPPLTAWPVTEEPRSRPVEVLRVEDRIFQSWQEAEEREVAGDEASLGTTRARPHLREFSFPGRRGVEPISTTDGTIPGVLVREQYAIAGAVETSISALGDSLFRVAVTVQNRTPLETPVRRDGALLRSLVSTHVLLGVREGEFLSLTDPPEDCRTAAAACRNVGLWPVLVGEPGPTDTLLASPIILYDYPQLAPESPGDLFDGTEIDEILSLRILTLTDDEKRQAAAVDERTRAILARTEALGPEEWLGLHGAVRKASLLPGGVADG